MELKWKKKYQDTLNMDYSKSWLMINPFCWTYALVHLDVKQQTKRKLKNIMLQVLHYPEKFQPSICLKTEKNTEVKKTKVRRPRQISRKGETCMVFIIV